MAKILIVDDDGALRNDIADKLTEWGHQVFQAADGRIGFAVIQNRLPDLVLSDINMPRESGFDLVKRVTDLGSHYADMAFLFMSSMTESKSIVYGIHCGADDYITKPIDYDLLKVKIESHLRKKNNLLTSFLKDRLALSMNDSMITGFMFIAALTALGLIAIAALYWIKMVLGIDVFQDVHLSDFF